MTRDRGMVMILVHKSRKIKLFPQDKNYLLKEAMFVQKDDLLHHLVNTVKEYYQKVHNPLGLIDDTITKITNSKISVKKLSEFYDDLAGIYRYKHGYNQLEINFDGIDHFEKFKLEWNKKFKEWILDFCAYKPFLKAVLEVSIFYPEHQKAELANSRFKVILAHFFELKVYKYKGINEFKVA